MDKAASRAVDFRPSATRKHDTSVENRLAQTIQQTEKQCVRPWKG